MSDEIGKPDLDFATTEELIEEILRRCTAAGDPCIVVRSVQENSGRCGIRYGRTMRLTESIGLAESLSAILKHELVYGSSDEDDEQ